jgi:hypothetical protein
MVGQDLPERGGEPRRLVVVALPDVALEDQAGGAGLHGLARLVQHGLVPGALAPGDQQGVRFADLTTASMACWDENLARYGWGTSERFYGRGKFTLTTSAPSSLAVRAA